MDYKFRIREKTNGLNETRFYIEIGEKSLFWYNWDNIFYHKHCSLIPKTDFCFFKKEDAESILFKYKKLIEEFEMKRKIIKDIKYNY